MDAANQHTSQRGLELWLASPADPRAIAAAAELIYPVARNGSDGEGLIRQITIA